MIFGDENEASLISRHFVVNIAMPALSPEGLVVTNRDPRKQRIKPGAYIGTVEECAADCQFIKPGDSIVFERWEWQQMNVDSERLVAREREVLVVNNKPAPNVMVLELINKPKTTLLYVPDTVRPTKSSYYHGKIVATNANAYFGEIGEEVYIEAHGEGQFENSRGILFFQLGRGANVLMRLKRNEPILEVV